LSKVSLQNYFFMFDSGNPVVLVHGLTDTSNKMRYISDRLRAAGRKTYSIDLQPGTGEAPLELLAQQLAGFIDRYLGPTAALDLVGFSMGGLVTRYYVQRLGGIDRVEHYVTLSAPHRGTIAAYFTGRAGCVQMRPNSEFLRDLQSDVMMLDKVKFTSIWTAWDTIILPAQSSCLPVGKDVQLPVLAHPLMVVDYRSLDAIATGLGIEAQY
jgi:triacylglycerol lipase